MSQKPKLDGQEQLSQLSRKELVTIILAQQETIDQLKVEIEKLKIGRNLDSKISSKPPSSDLLKKPETESKSSGKKRKRSPGGQLGHQGKTRKGFGRVDRYEVIKAEKCSRGEIENQLGAQYSGVIISDDFSVYNGYPVAAQQKCQAHLRRHCQRLIKTPGKNNKFIGVALSEIVDEAFRKHRLWRENNQQQDYLDWAAQLKTKINLTLTEWGNKAGYEAGKLLRNLKLKADQWWYFLDHPQIPPDNNLAERALRLAVTKRKVSGGSSSMERFQDTAHLLSVIQTCRFQGRSVMDFFTQALMATIGVIDRPSLISQFDT